jgi:uncharacterized membrane protein YoaT (DUF817 family)
MRNFTSVERLIDERAHRFLDGASSRSASPVSAHAGSAQAGRARSRLTEFVVFGLKQGWACIFGAALLAVILAARLWYPADAGLARNDFLTIAAVVIQILMVATRLETVRELRVIVLFHLVGTAMELFKTDVGSWSYDAEGFLRIGAVPLFSGFMYAAVGSYMVRVYRLFDLRFAWYPRRWVTAIIAAAIYLNFFTHHYIWDARWVLLAAVVIAFGRCVMHFRVFRGKFRMPLVLAFLLVALFIWIAENIATWSGAWLYPSQVDGWHMVSPDKLVSWFLLMIISVVLVAWVYKPQPPQPLEAPVNARGEEASPLLSGPLENLPEDGARRVDGVPDIVLRERP